jgi:type IV secretion system protein VirB9
MRLLLFIILLFLHGGVTFAKQEPRSISGDEHIKVMNYNPHAIHKYTGFYGYQSSILFENGEIIQSITMGDTKGWQLVPQGNRLFIKPIDDIADTNATIITSRRVYYFELHADEATGLDDPRLAYEVRFLYPLFNDDGLYSNGGNVFEQVNVASSVLDLNDIEIVKKGINFNYSVSHVQGSESIVPIKAFDDGKFTYLQFRKHTEFPAVFFVNSRGSEALVNFRVENDFLIIERIASVFTLRSGSSTACLFNENIPFKKSKKKRS